MKYYPAFLDLRGKKVLVVGGGLVAQRKIDTLLECEAAVSVVAKDLTPVLKRYVEEGRVRFSGTEFEDVHMQGARLVIAATDDQDLNRRVSLLARENGVLVNAVDQPPDCTFIVPSILRRGDLVIAVSTSGKSPALARRLRERLDRMFGPEYEPYLLLLGRLRDEILAGSLPSVERAEVFRSLVHSDLPDWIRIGEWERVASTLNKALGTNYSAREIQELAGVA